jgi:geranylgeranyl pyrophosphate synthase
MLERINNNWPQLGLNGIKEMPSTDLLSNYRDSFNENVLPIVDRYLRTSSNRKWIKGIFAPLWYTLKNRKNFFRSSLLLFVGRLSEFPEATAELAACVEIAWTCALILDDIVDQSNEREGQLSAYARFGVFRSFGSVMVALIVVFCRLCFCIPGRFRLRMARIRLSVVLFLRCVRTQIGKKRPSSLTKYFQYAKDVNASLYWALLSPIADKSRNEIHRLLSAYADHSTVAGKMRNDFLDYFGGASERVGRFEDFNRRRITFPVLILKQCKLDPEDKRSLNNYFVSKLKLEPHEILKIFRRYRVGEKGFNLFTIRLKLAREILKQMEMSGVEYSLINELQRWNDYMEEGFFNNLALISGFTEGSSLCDGRVNATSGVSNSGDPKIDG